MSSVGVAIGNCAGVAFMRPSCPDCGPGPKASACVLSPAVFYSQVRFHQLVYLRQITRLSLCLCYLIYKMETGQERWLSSLRALTALPEDLGSGPSTDTGQLATACKCSSRGSNVLFWPPQAHVLV